MLCLSVISVFRLELRIESVLVVIGYIPTPS
jgi:hypothetical protein